MEGKMGGAVQNTIAPRGWTPGIARGSLDPPSAGLRRGKRNEGDSRRAAEAQRKLGNGEGRRECHGMNYRTKAEYFIQGITQGFVEASEVIAWSDEVVTTAAKPEDWMLEISSCGPDDRMVVLSHLNTVKGVADPVELAALLKAKGIG